MSTDIRTTLRGHIVYVRPGEDNAHRVFAGGDYMEITDKLTAKDWVRINAVVSKTQVI